MAPIENTLDFYGNNLYKNYFVTIEGGFEQTIFFFFLSKVK